MLVAGALALGGVLGMHFACCAALWPARAGNQASVAGWLYAADLAGATLASLLVAAVVIPAEGHASAASWGAAYAGVSFVVTILGTSMPGRMNDTAPAAGGTC